MQDLDKEKGPPEWLRRIGLHQSIKLFSSGPEGANLSYITHHPSSGVAVGQFDDQPESATQLQSG
jgi:hypothetical protein